MKYGRYESPLGPLLLAWEEEALTGLWMNREMPEQVSPVPEAVKQWLDNYFLGNPREISFPLKTKGTPFQQQVWQILRTIPFGQTRTYGDIAREMASLTGKKNMSAQAIGQAVGKNPISILIPCHRCVGAGGKLTGYAGGLEKKVWLLEHEKSCLPLPMGEASKAQGVSPAL